MIHNIIAAFYFVYWVYYNQQPFSIWWLVLIYLAIFIFLSTITSILKGSSKAIEKKAYDIDDKIKDFERRLKCVEERNEVKEDG